MNKIQNTIHFFVKIITDPLLKNLFFSNIKHGQFPESIYNEPLEVLYFALAIDCDAAHFPTAATLAKVSLEAGGLLGWVWKKKRLARFVEAANWMQISISHANAKLAAIYLSNRKEGFCGGVQRMVRGFPAWQ